MLFAQGVSFGLDGEGFESDAPLEVTSDTLEVNQGNGTATFRGNVLASRPDFRISAEEILVEYSQESDGIHKVIAKDQVVVVLRTRSAKADNAVYLADSEIIEMSGNVLLNMGNAIVSGDRLTFDVKKQSGSVEGRVKTVLNNSSN